MSVNIVDLFGGIQMFEYKIINKDMDNLKYNV